METELKRGPGRPKNTPPTVEDIDTMRPDLRPEMRFEDPVEAAAFRTKEIMDRLGGIMPDWADEFEIPEHLKRPGWEIEWKRWSVGNQEDTSHVNSLQEAGWTFVPSDRPGWNRYLPRGWKQSIVVKKEMVAMERPAEFNRLVREQKLLEARTQVRRKEQQVGEAPPGTLPRQDSAGNTVGSVKRTISGPIPN